MKTVAFLVIISIAVTFGQDDETLYAHCGLSGSGAGGHICFKYEANQLSAQIHVTGVTANRRSTIHIHRNQPDDNCDGAGKVYNIPGTPGSEGNLGKPLSNAHCNIHIEDHLINGLSLTDPHSIIDKAVVVHLPGSGKACCVISSIRKSKYTRMTGKAAASIEKHTCPPE